jgi:hypothetical protein
LRLNRAVCRSVHRFAFVVAVLAPFTVSLLPLSGGRVFSYMADTWLFLGFLLIVVAGAVVIWRLRRQRLPSSADLPEVGYGRARWERELALWEGTLGRLHTQAARYGDGDLPPHLDREIKRAEARIARARAALAQEEEGDGNGALRVEQ